RLGEGPDVPCRASHHARRAPVRRGVRSASVGARARARRRIDDGADPGASRRATQGGADVRPQVGNAPGIAGVYLSRHTPRYCTYDAAIANRLAHPDFQGVRDGLVEQGRHVAALAPDVIVINSCHLITTFPTVVDGTPRHR